MHYGNHYYWTNNGKEFKTRGLDSDQTVAAIIDTKNAECDPDPNPLRRDELNELDHKTRTTVQPS
jgi:D-citramalate synthase